MARHEAGVVDDHVPPPAAQRIELSVAIADKALQFGEKLHLGLIEERDAVPALDGQVRDMHSDEARAAEDQDAQGLRPRSRRGTRGAEHARRHCGGSNEFPTAHFQLPRVLAANCARFGTAEGN